MVTSKSPEFYVNIKNDKIFFLMNLKKDNPEQMFFKKILCPRVRKFFGSQVFFSYKSTVFVPAHEHPVSI
jgi:hypothetical protein